MSKLSIVIPVYFNEDTLMDLYQDLKEKILPKLEEYELVFVDDGSGDRSWQVMNEIKTLDESVHLVKLSRNFGEHAALLAGLTVSTGDCAITKQADLQEDSSLILEMYESWKKGNKVVLAIRRIPARMVATISPSVPSFMTIPATIVANAAVGPAICTRLPPKKDTRNPAMIAV